MTETTPPPAIPDAPAYVPPAADRFVHLHVHSEYSPLDGLNDPYTLVRIAGHAGQPAIAITDHGRVSGTAEFWDGIDWYNRVHAERHAASDACKKNGCHSVRSCEGSERCPKAWIEAPEGSHGVLAPIKGILGIEAYIADKGMFERELRDYAHVVILALDDRGWANVRELASRASLEGFYSYPRIDLALLEQYRDGIVVLSACLGGHLAKTWRASGPDAADTLIRRYQEILGQENYYLELQWHNDQRLDGDPHDREQHELNVYLLGAAERTGAPLVMTNDAHYSRRVEATDEGYLLAIQQRTTVAEAAAASRRGDAVAWFDTPDFYLKTRGEMGQALANWLKACDLHDKATAEKIRSGGKAWLDASLAIAERAVLAEPFRGGLHFPHFPVPEGHTAESFLAERVWAKADGRYPAMREQTRRLIAYELQCVQELGFSAYFLITEDFVDYARAEGIDVGLGRGSAPGSVVTYVLGITDVDPISYGLSEGGIGLTRFLNPTVLYGLTAEGFGELPAAFAPGALEVPAVEVMEQAIVEALREKTRTANAFGAEGRDPLTGATPATEAELATAKRIWSEWKPRLADEWELIKKYGAANETAQATQKETRFTRGSLVEPLYRWMKAVEAGHPAGPKNDHGSLIARFLGLADLEVRMLDGEAIPLLPIYEFRHSRKSMPDIDIDFTPGHDGREKVMRYVTEKYGADHVCQIATFGTLLAKSALTDVARSKGLPFEEAKRLTGLIPKKFAADRGGDDDEAPPAVTLKEMITSDRPGVVEASKELRAAMAADPLIDSIIRQAARLEGVKRTEGTHACGVLITPEPVTHYVAVSRSEKGTGKQAVHDGPTLTDKLGLLKVDFLGLKNLKVNRETVDRIQERSGVIVDWKTVPDDDPDAMKLLRDGKTLGIFQFASDFATGILKGMKPRRVQDLMVATALGRPGPMEYIPDYINARARGTGTYGDPVFETYAKPILEETYGVLVYQEQVMLLAIDLSDFSLPESDGLRKATAKKDATLLAKYRGKFVEGAVKKGVARPFIEHYWDAVLTPFAAYSFNKSHSAAYALTAYKQAYLKAKYTPEFVAALMTVDQNEGAKETGGISPLAKAVAEARRLGYPVLPVDVNRSTARIEIEARPEGGEALRMSLVAAKGIGERPINAIVADRERGGTFSGLGDFIRRMVEAEREVDPETGKKLPAAVNKTVVMVLAKCGAFDAFGDRKAAIAKLEEYFGTTSVKKRAAVNFDALPALRRPLPQDYLDWEQELLGAYLTSHPAEGLPAEIWEQATDTVNDLLVFGTKADDDEDGRDRKETRTVVGVITKAEIRVTRAKGIEFLSGTIADDTGSGKWQWWAPRPGREAPEIHRAYAAMKAAIEAATIKGEGAILRGVFEASKDYGNSMGLVDYTLVPLPRLAPELPEAEAALARPADTTVLAPSPEQVSAGLDELFD